MVSAGQRSTLGRRGGRSSTLFGLLAHTMSSVHPGNHDPGTTLSQAALIAGVCLLIMVFTAPFAEFIVYPKVVVAGNIEDTARSILARRGLFLAGVFSYTITLICDVVVAWALYVLLMPANRSVSLLAAWFRLVHAVVALFGLLKLVTAFRLLITPDYEAAVGSDHMHAQVRLLLNSFRYEWSFGMVFFAIHLGLLGYLVYRSGYIPGILGILLAAAGLGHLLYCLGPYLYPDADLRLLMITFFGDLIFTLWLLARGRKIPQPAARA